MNLEICLSTNNCSLSPKDFSVSDMIGVSWSLSRNDQRHPATDEAGSTHVLTDEVGHISLLTDEAWRSSLFRDRRGQKHQSRPTTLDPFCSRPTRPNIQLRLHHEFRDRRGRIFLTKDRRGFVHVIGQFLPPIYTWRIFMQITRRRPSVQLNWRFSTVQHCGCNEPAVSWGPRNQEPFNQWLHV
jgi:hypothetical protein